MTSKINYKNTIVKHVISQKDVKYVGTLTAVVEIAQKPIFGNSDSIDVMFYGRPNKKVEPTVVKDMDFLGQGTIRYKSIGAKNYSGRIALNLIFSNGYILPSTHPYQSSIKVAKELLPQIIADHEKAYSK
jgi:hypothetical protein